MQFDMMRHASTFGIHCQPVIPREQCLFLYSRHIHVEIISLDYNVCSVILISHIQRHLVRCRYTTLGTIPDRSRGTLDCCTGCAVLYRIAPLAQSSRARETRQPFHAHTVTYCSWPVSDSQVTYGPTKTNDIMVLFASEGRT
jgi:hypothetical protein